MSARRVRYHEGAVADVKSAVTWYREHSPKVALDFIEELKRALDTIRKTPKRWPEGANGTRRFLLWRFPFSIVYSEEDRVIMIWAVAHGSRKPEYWARRIRKM